MQRRNFMGSVIDASIVTHFVSLEDLRDIRGKEHLLLEIMTIALCGVISGAEGLGRHRRVWKSKTGLAGDIPVIAQWNSPC